jgi:hypothetical protein
MRLCTSWCQFTLIGAVAALVCSPASAQLGETLELDEAAGQISVRFPPNNLGEPRFLPEPDDAEQKRVFASIIEESVRPYIDLVEARDLFMNDLWEGGKLYPVEFVIDEWI